MHYRPRFARQSPTEAKLLWETYEIRGTRYNVFSLGIFAHWMKRHVSGRPHGVRTRPLSLILADAKSSLLGRFFLLPTKAELLREPYEVRKWLPQNANAVRFVGKRRRRRPKRRFFAGKPSNCAGRRRWVKAQPCRLNRATTQGRPYGSVFRNPRRVGTWSFCSLFLTEKLHIFDQCLLLPTKAELLRERGGVGAQSEGFSQENRAIAPGDDDGSRLSLAD